MCGELTECKYMDAKLIMVNDKYWAAAYRVLGKNIVHFIFSTREGLNGQDPADYSNRGFFSAGTNYVRTRGHA